MSTNTATSVGELSPEDETLVTRHYEGKTTADNRNMTEVARSKLKNILSALRGNPDHPFKKDLEEELTIVRSGDMSHRM